MDAPVNSIDEFDLLNAFFISVNAAFGGASATTVTFNYDSTTILAGAEGEPPIQTINESGIGSFTLDMFDFSSGLFSTLFGSSSGSAPVLGPSGGVGGGGNKPSPRQPATRTPGQRSYLGCVASTTLHGALWGGITGAVTDLSASFVLAVGMGVAGSTIGLEGTLAGAGLGFGLGISFLPEQVGAGAVGGAIGGLVEGGYTCIKSR